MSQLHERARQVFDEVLERPGSERERALAVACGPDTALRQSVEQLLRDHDEAQGSFPEAPSSGECPGDRIGPYKLLEVIGEGGFGTVWLAEQQQPIRRKVALKVVKWGMDTRQVVARFEAERQALALMDHPHIAKVLDGGSTESGRPYFAMELVRGVPLTKYCDEAKLTPRERIALFVPVCEAVQHAHQKGVIHRDLKPSNVLVTLHDGKPVPKVIDFGIAKATAGQLTDKTVFTGFRQMLGTPEYMAPEQAEMSGLDVDTRADIYSLGVLLYELLTGTKPFELKVVLEAGWEELLRRIKEVDPDKPSTRVSTLGERLAAIATSRRMLPKGLSSAFRGDVDWIVLKAMEKERGRRYETAHAFADDLQRHLRDEPVEASPPGRIYRLRKYARRHRVGVAAGLAIGGSLAVGVVLAGFGYAAAKAQEATAVAAAKDSKRQATKAQHVIALLDQMLSSADPQREMGPDYRVRDLLEDFESRLPELTADEPEVAATLSGTLGRSFLGLGLVERAAPHLERNLVAQRQTYGESSDEFAVALLTEARVQRGLGRFEEAEAAVRRGLDILDRSPSADPRQCVDARRELAEILWESGKITDAEQEHRRVVELCRRVPGDARDILSRGLSGLAENLHDRGDFAGAEEALTEALRLARAEFGDDHRSVARLMDNLSELLRSQGDLPAATRTCEEALAMRTRLLADGYPVEIVINLQRLCRFRAYAGERAGSEAALAKAEDLVRWDLGERHELAASLCKTAAIQREAFGDLRGVVAAWQRKLDFDRRRLGATHLEVGRDLAELGMNQLELRHIDRSAVGDASVSFEQAESILRAAEGDHRAWLAIIHNGRGVIAMERKDWAVAEKELQRAEELARAAAVWRVTPENRSCGTILINLGRVSVERGDLASAERYFREALEIKGRQLDPERELVVAVSVDLADVLDSGDRGAEAEAVLREALEQWRRHGGHDHADVVRALNMLSVVLKKQRQPEHRSEVLDLSREAVAMRRRLAGAGGDGVATLVENLIATLRSERTAAADAEAVALLRELIPERQAILGPSDQVVVFMRANLAGILEQMHRLGEAEVVFREQVESLRGGTEAQRGWLATALGGLARCEADDGRTADALTHAEEALSIRRGCDGEDSMSVAGCHSQVGALLASLGRHAEAEPHLRAALARFRRESGRERDVAVAAGVLGETLLRLGTLQEAEVLLREVVDLVRRHEAKRPARLAAEQSRLGVVLLRQKRFADAEPILRENVEQWRAAAGESDVNFGQGLKNLASAMDGLGRRDEAIALLEQAVDVFRGADGDATTEHLVGSLGLLALRLAEAGRVVEAEPIAKEGLAIADRRLPGSRSHGLALSYLGRVVATLGRLEEAEPLLREACTRLMATAPMSLPRQTIAALVALYRQQGKEADAAAWEAKLGGKNGRDR